MVTAVATLHISESEKLYGKIIVFKLPSIQNQLRETHDGHSKSTMPSAG